MAFLAPAPIHVSPSRPSARRRRRPSVVQVRATATVPPEAPSPSEQSQDPFQTTLDAVKRAINSKFDRLYEPIPSLLPPLTRPWDKTQSNYILHPLQKPKAVLHFLGGAFIGAAPHLLYHTLLTKLSARGYVVVATPYDLSFDYLPLTESICSAWEAVETDLAARYGPLPVIGLGHSAGCLFHALSSCLFEDAAPRAGMVMVSFNNRAAREAIPGYAELVLPFARLGMAVRQGAPDDAVQFLDTLPETVDNLLRRSPLSPDKFVSTVLPTVQEARRFFEQIPPLLEQIASEPNLREFYPCPDDVRASLEKLYPVEQTLVVQFGNDSLDDSPVLTDALRKGGKDVSVVELVGSHVTPLVQEPNLSGIGELLGELFVAGAGGELDRLIRVLDEWIDAGIANDRL